MQHLLHIKQFSGTELKAGKNGHACHVYGCSCGPIQRGSYMLCQLFEVHRFFTSLHVACQFRLDRQPGHFLGDFKLSSLAQLFEQLFVFYYCGCYSLLVFVSFMAML